MKCKFCNNEFKDNDEIEKHELECSHTFGNHNYENMIPCEICDDLIHIDNYTEHINNCQVRVPIPIPINIPLQNINNLLDAKKLGINCFLVSWGYTSKDDFRIANNNNITIIKEDDLFNLLNE